MSEQRLQAFAERAESLVDTPDYATLRGRGRRLRRGRQSAGAVALAGVLAAVALSVFDLGQDRADEPIGPPDQQAPPTELYEESARNGLLPAGRYLIRVGSDDRGPGALVTTPPGWQRWAGPNRYLPPDGYVGLLVVQVDEIATRPCRAGDGDGLEPVEPGATALVEALSGQPGHRLVQGPEPDDRFGRPATHLRLRATDRAACPDGQDYGLWGTRRVGLIDWRPETEGLMDLWVVDVGTRRPALVSASWAAGTPAWAVAELRAMVDTLEFVVP